MKTALIALASLSLLACSASSSESTTEESATEPAALASASGGATVYRGRYDVAGATYLIELELTSVQKVQQVKYCEPDFAGASTSPSYQEEGGTIRTIVRKADGAIVADATASISAFSSYADIDLAKHCTKKGRIANFEPMTTFELADPLVWVPGVVAATANGPLWINPSYGGVARVALSFAGTTTYRALSSESKLQPRPFDIEGQELVFTKGEATFTPGPKTIQLEVGSDVDGFFARHVETITLTRE